MINQTVILAFDPDRISNEIREIFADDLTRTLWLGVRQGHLVGPDFHKDCVTYAKYIKRVLEKEGRASLTAAKLLWILSGGYAPPGEGIIGMREADFAAELLPYILGEKKIEFKISPPKTPECHVEA